MSETKMPAEPPTVSPECATTFMAKLLDPLPVTEILDPDLARIERKAAREERARLGREWRFRMMDAELFFHRMRVAQGERREAYRLGRDAAIALAAQVEAQAAWHEAAKGMIGVPAPDARAVRWKRATYAFRFQRETWMDEAIAEDERWLAQSSARPAEEA